MAEHTCHTTTPSPFIHTIVCPTGEHPTGWQHMPGPHKMCTTCAESRGSGDTHDTTTEHTHQWTYGYMVRTCWCGAAERATLR